MVHIVKKKEPPSLLIEKRNGLSDYGDLSGATKKAIQISLLEEQGYLCAYCMKRISLKHMQIEHYIPQHPTNRQYTPALSIDYHNMLAVCTGNKGSARGFDQLTCDQHRGNRPLAVNPLDMISIEKIKYKSDGTIYSDDTNVELDLNETLNLNCSTALLKQNRKAALDEVKRYLYRNFPKHKAPKHQLEHLLERFQSTDANHRYKEFVGVIIWYLSKEISRT